MRSWYSIKVICVVLQGTLRGEERCRRRKSDCHFWSGSMSQQSDVTAQYDRIIIVRGLHHPPPPPLSSVVDDWTPLYFFIGLCVLYAICMFLVAYSFCGPSMRSGEAQPLKTPPRPKQQQQQPPGYGRRRPATWGKPSWADPEIDPYHIEVNRAIDGWTRAAFIRKVYGILSTQLLATTGIITAMIYAAFVHGDPKYPSDFAYYIAGPGYYLTLLVMLVSMCLLCALMTCRTNYPLNMIGLGAFTCCIAFYVGVLCILYYGRGYGGQILLAFVITTASFLFLTVFTIFSKIDFNFLGPALCAGTFLLLIMSLILSIAFAFGGFSKGWGIVLAVLGVCLFIGFIIYDTYQIVTRLGCDDYVVAAIELYLDMINMFMYVLSCLVLCGGRD